MVLSSSMKADTNTLNLKSATTKPTNHIQPAIHEPKRPTYGPQVVVQSEAELRELKNLKKEQKKAARAANRAGQGVSSAPYLFYFLTPFLIFQLFALEDESLISSNILGFEGANLRQAREEALRAATAAPLFSSSNKSAAAEQYPHVYQAAQTGNTLSFLGTRYALPKGTVRQDYKVHVFRLRFSLSGRANRQIGRVS